TASASTASGSGVSAATLAASVTWSATTLAYLGAKRSSSASRSAGSSFQPTTERPERASRTVSSVEGTILQPGTRRGVPVEPLPARAISPERRQPREPHMPVSETTITERIARVLAGQRASANAEGYLSSAGDVVDDSWREHLDDARAVLRTLREPDASMAAAGNVETWRAMVEAALEAEG